MNASKFMPGPRLSCVLMCQWVIDLWWGWR